ncbi:MAG: DUF4142 domain-containing protein [Oceanicaulis sp.]
MLRMMTLAASVSALALSACADTDTAEDETEAAMADAGEESGMASANSSMAERASDADREARRAEADAQMDGGMDREMGAAQEGDGAITREGSDMSGAAGDPPDAEQSEAVSDFTYGAEYSEDGMGTAPPTAAIQAATERVIGMTDDEISDFDAEAEAYVRAVTLANRYQVEAGRIASDRGGEPEIRELGEDIVEIHENQLGSLREAIDTAGLGMEPPQQIDGGREDVLTALSEVAEVNFDPVFVRQQTSLHESLNSLHEAYAESGSVDILVTFAEAAAERTSEGLERIRNDHEAALDPN